MIYLILLPMVLMLRNCAEKKGTYVIRLHIHADGGAVAKILASHVLKGTYKGKEKKNATLFFKGILDDINKSIMGIGVQVLGDFTKFNLALGLPLYDITRCLEPNPETLRGRILANAMGADGKLGSRLFVLYCPLQDMLPSRSTIIPKGSCQSAISIVYSDLPLFKMLIHNSILQLVASRIGGLPVMINDRYCDEVCSFISSCKDNPAENIKYIHDLKSLRHLSGETQILKDGEKLQEHDIYDYMYIKNHKGKHFELKEREDKQYADLGFN